MIEQILQADRYLQVDQVDKARDVYQRVVDLDPGNAIAVMGLARCALAEGDDRRAYELASQALEIDPENDMARRMEARLSEILTTRGEPVQRPGPAATSATGEMRPVVTDTPREPSAAPAGGPPMSPQSPQSPAMATPRPPTLPPAKAKEPAVRKTLFDRLLGR